MTSTRRHLQGVALRLVVIDPELRFLLRHHIGERVSDQQAMLAYGTKRQAGYLTWVALNHPPR
jgi:hypothetical protein